MLESSPNLQEKKNRRKFMVKAFIFDLDGTLIDSHKAHVNAFKKVLHKHDLYTTRNELKKYFGMQEEDILKKLFPKISSKVLDQIMFEKRKEFIKNIHLVEKKPCADKVLKMSNKKGPVALATCCHLSEVSEIIKQFNWGNYFKTIVTSYEVPRPKPAPDILLRTIKILNAKKQDAVFIGDTIYDAMASQSAGIKFIGVNKDEEVINGLKALGVKNTHRTLCTIFSSA